MNRINIHNRVIGKDSPCFIIAEAGVNHNGNLNTAIKMVDAAKEAGVDAIKFQTFKAKELVTETASLAPYQRVGTAAKSQYELLRSLELKQSDFERLFEYCKRKRIIFLSTPFDYPSAHFLFNLNVPAFKLSSGEITNIPFLRKLAKFAKPMILSTGMSTLQEVREAVSSILSSGNKNIALLHCTSLYPCPFRSANLNAIKTLRDRFNFPVGYSDHTIGIEVAIAAVALGARVLEKHFTLDKKMKGPDHRSSISPDELKKMVLSIRNLEESMGNGIKIPSESEIKMKSVIRKSIVLQRDVRKGERLSEISLACKRPGNGIAPKDMCKIVDKIAKKNLKKGTILKWSMLDQKEF